MEKKCSLCGEKKDSKFIRYGNYPDGSKRWAHSKCNQKHQTKTGDTSAQKNWAKRNPHRVSIYQRVHKARKEGLLSKPEYCEKCERETWQLQAHHPDYSKILDVIWLCRSCHGDMDKKTEDNKDLTEIYQAFNRKGICLAESDTKKGLSKKLGMHDGYASKKFRKGNKHYYNHFFESTTRYIN